MSRQELIICDACGFSESTSEIAKHHWEVKPSCFEAKCPKDGVNGGVWKMDVCASCRRELHEAINKTIEKLRLCVREAKG